MAGDRMDLRSAEYWLQQIWAALGGSTGLTGSVTVTNLPATQPVSGSVSVSNLPATQPVSGTVTADTEMPAAAALADATANPTTTTVGAVALGFNGTTWDRLRTALVAVQTAFTGILAVLPLVRYNATPPTLADGNGVVLQGDVNGNLKSREQYAPVYEDNTLGKAVVEHRYSYGRVTADGQIKASAGFIHSVSFAPLVAIPTAGLITIYDNTAESGTVIYSEWQFATGIGHTIILDVVCATGIYVGFDAAAANFQVTVGYR